MATKSTQQPEVRFRLEVRPATLTQQDAGRRIFSRLIERAHQSLADQQAPANPQTWSAPRADGFSRRPLPPPTIRGADFTSRTENTKERE